VPADIPVTMPEPSPIDAIVVAPLLHVPPVAASLSAEELPIHIVATPVIEGGGGVTATVVVILQPVPDNL
jgi:hypothetical protein